eukprot:snap_masked-scaffold_5-processed-gene-4.21-mRNA-1 protein AED:1.00 eAED:1.00 QI:0/-1/0/0/-1/1/1/0/72
MARDEKRDLSLENLKVRKSHPDATITEKLTDVSLDKNILPMKKIMQNVVYSLFQIDFIALLIHALLVPGENK